MHTNLSSVHYYYARTDDLMTLTQDLGSGSILSFSHTYWWMFNTPRELKVCNPKPWTFPICDGLFLYMSTSYGTPSKVSQVSLPESFSLMAIKQIQMLSSAKTIYILSF